MKNIKDVIPHSLKHPLRRLKKMAVEFMYAGTEKVCPVCGKSSKRFRTAGTIPRKDAQCVYCGALERHRFLWLFWSKKTTFLSRPAGRMLHIAPEPCFEPRLKRKLGNQYLTADLNSTQAMVRMDITAIDYPDQWFDVIYCSHVLEHVHDDRLAMREFFRVLKNDGWAVVMVPITAEHSFEDDTIVSPEARFEAYGQSDHVRAYGPDFPERLREAGFHVTAYDVADVADRVSAEKMGLTSACGIIFYCTKRIGSQRADHKNAGKGVVS